MFIGIVEELGLVREIARRPPGAHLRLGCRTVIEDLAVGDSISVNGCCLTAIEVSGDQFTAEIMGETLERTALGALRTGAAVNLERAARLDARIGGHVVQGHVDGVGVVLAVDQKDEWAILTCSLPAELGIYVVEKGSIAVDGVSLTVMSVDDGHFRVGLIPHTLAATTLGRMAVGDMVNLEADVVGKYVERMVRGGVETPYRPQ
ncbi:MAG TPA: riboflavin synthase [Egibacteraceae bacterium]|nr:riboflavin synthase [Egibacteraceae bacterium]